MGAPFKTPISRDALRARMERAIERLIAALDVLDAAGEDLEDEFEDGDLSDFEPSLAAPEPLLATTAHVENDKRVILGPQVSQVGWCRGGGEDCELGDDNGIADSGGLQEAWHHAI